MYSVAIKNQALEMRQNGYSYSAIARKLSVAKSTLSVWLRGVPYNPNEETKKHITFVRSKLVEGQAHRKKKSIHDARQAARIKIGTMSKRDVLMLGLGLYIGEGSKSAQIVKVSNAEPSIIAFAVQWFESIGVPKKHMTLAVHAYPDTDIPACLDFWEKVTGIPQAQFGKVQIDTRVKNINKRGRCKYGTAHVRIRGLGNPRLGVYLYRHIEGLMLEAFQQTISRD